MLKEAFPRTDKSILNLPALAISGSKTPSCKHLFQKASKSETGFFLRGAKLLDQLVLRKS